MTKQQMIKRLKEMKEKALRKARADYYEALNKYNARLNTEAVEAIGKDNLDNINTHIKAINNLVNRIVIPHMHKVCEDHDENARNMWAVRHLRMAGITNGIAPIFLDNIIRIEEQQYKKSSEGHKARLKYDQLKDHIASEYDALIGNSKAMSSTELGVLLSGLGESLELPPVSTALLAPVDLEFIKAVRG